MNIGIIGAGGIVPAHLEAAKALGVRVSHIADSKIEAARGLADAYGIDRVSTDAAAVIDDRDVDVVIVALPTFLHHDWLIRCAEAGKHILTEKPLCRTVDLAKEVIDTCDRCGVKLAIGYQRRFSPARMKIRELVQSGALGRPVTWNIATFSPRCDFYRGPNNWMWDIEKGGGMVMDGSIHDFDFAAWILGRPVSIFAQSRCICDTATAPTQASAIVSFAGGDNLIYTAAWQEGDLGGSADIYRIVGPNGTIIPTSEFSFIYSDSPGNSTRICLDPTPLFEDQLQSFIRYAETGVPDYRLTTGKDALSSLWIAENIVDAGAEGRVRGNGEVW
jgi:predicted dehydrogenase